MEQKENKVNSNPKKRLSQSSSSLFAKPLLKPVPRADIAKKSTTTSKANSKPALATPTSVATTENGFKTPFKPVQSRIKATSSTTDLGNIKAKIQEEMAALDIEKPLLDPISKSVMKPTVRQNLLLNKINTPLSAKKGKQLCVQQNLYGCYKCFF